MDGACLSDEQLLEGLRAGDAVAFSQIYRAQAVAVYNLCLRLLGNPEDAQDVTQEVFIKACRQLPGCDANFRVKPWLYRVAVNACYDQLRKRRSHGMTESLPEELYASPIDAFEQAELGEALEQTLAGLSVRHRTVLVLKDVHGLSHAEIAATLGISHGAAEILLFRAHEAFRRGYAELVRTEPREACVLARQAVVDSAGTGVSDRQRRRLIAHAKKCPDCRKTVATWSLGAFCLGAFLRVTPLPTALARPPLAAAARAGVVRSIGATGARVAASHGAGLAKAGPAAAGTVGGGSAHAAALTAGAVIKASVMVIAAGALVVSGGATIHHLVSGSRPALTKLAAANHVQSRGRARSLAALSAMPSSASGRGSTAETHGHRAAKSRASTNAGKGAAVGRTSAAGQNAGHSQHGQAAGSKGKSAAAKSKGKSAAAKSKGKSATAKSKAKSSVAKGKAKGSAAKSKGNGASAKSKGNGASAKSKGN
jgi:RNA polymerase sigma-70 factor (ECF subfamily)